MRIFIIELETQAGRKGLVSSEWARKEGTTGVVVIVIKCRQRVYVHVYMYVHLSLCGAA